MYFAAFSIFLKDLYSDYTKIKQLFKISCKLFLLIETLRAKRPAFQLIQTKVGL